MHYGPRSESSPIHKRDCMLHATDRRNSSVCNVTSISESSPARLFQRTPLFLEDRLISRRSPVTKLSLAPTWMLPIWHRLLHPLYKTHVRMRERNRTLGQEFTTKLWEADKKTMGESTEMQKQNVQQQGFPRGHPP